jgi:hypothetical protein
LYIINTLPFEDKQKGTISQGHHIILRQVISMCVKHHLPRFVTLRSFL